MGSRDLGTQEKYLAFSLEEKDLTLLELKLLGHLTMELSTGKETEAKKERSGSPTCFSLHLEDLTLLHTPEASICKTNPCFQEAHTTGFTGTYL